MDSDKPEIVIRYDLCPSGGYTAVSAERITEQGTETVGLIPGRRTRSDLLKFAAGMVLTFKPKSLGVSISGGPIRLISRRTVEDIASGKRSFDDLLVG